MTPQEQQLITSLFDRLRGVGAPEKDREAEALINSSVRAMPDVPYLLVQSTLIQEQALEAATARLKTAEARIQTLEEELKGRPSGSGSFLGGLFGGRGASDHAPAVLPSAPPISASPSPWPAAAPQQVPAAAAPASGGFMRSAMTTAAGVAGGMLAAGALRDMLGGSAHANPVTMAGTDQARRDHEALAQQDTQDDAQSDAEDDTADDAADSYDTAY